MLMVYRFTRLLQMNLMNVAGSCFERGAVAHSYACRSGRGNLAAIKTAARCTRANRFFLKLDIRRYFDSIHHDTLRSLFRRIFKDGAFLSLLDQVLGSFETKDGRGLPIGTLTSQYFANFYLDGLDHWIMESLGCRAYVRYMDDFVLWHQDAGVLEHWQGVIAGWLGRGLHLELKATPGAVACADGLPFLGYRVLPGRVLLGRAARQRFFQRLEGYEKAYGEGSMSAADLQRRADALLAFTQVAACGAWMQRGLASLPSAGID